MHEIKVGVAICTPMPLVKKSDGQLGLQHITVEWQRHRNALGFPTNINFYEICADGMEVGDARNHAANKALEVNAEFLLFIDSDVLIQYDALKKLLMRARHYPDHDIFSGIYCTKNATLAEPLIYKRNGEGPYWNWAIGDLVFDIASVGMGCALIRTSLFEKLEFDEDTKPWFYTPNEQKSTPEGFETNRGTEDIFFCNRAREEVDAKIMVDTSVLCGHQDLESGTVFGLPRDSQPVQSAHWHPIHKEDKDEDSNDEVKEELKVLDLGAGSTRREWKGYKTYTTDIREDTGADYIQDTRHLNLPEGYFDMVASSHHLEHIGRWDQELVWAQIYKIVKPGGKIEMIVPNVKWAASHIIDGIEDGHVMNVLYGAQEDHGYERIYNTHFFGYTPSIGKALAELVGFTNVNVETYEENEDLHYNMIIRAIKPEVPSEEDIESVTKMLEDDTFDEDILLEDVEENDVAEDDE